MDTRQLPGCLLSCRKKKKENKMKKKKWLAALLMAFVLSAMFGMTVCAQGKGDVAGAIEETWNDAS